MAGEFNAVGHRGMTSPLRRIVIRCIDVPAASALARPDSPSTTVSPASTRPISGSRRLSAHGSDDPRLPSTDYAASFLDPSEPAAERPPALAPSVSPSVNRVTAATRKKSASASGAAIERFTGSKSRRGGSSDRAPAVNPPRPEGRSAAGSRGR